MSNFVIGTTMTGATWEGSYSTSINDTSVIVSLYIYLKNNYIITVQDNPKAMPYIVPNTSFFNNHGDTITDISGARMQAWINSNSGSSSLYAMGSGQIATGLHYATNLTLTLAKGDSARNVTVFIGAGIQSTYWWSQLAGETSFSVAVPSAHTHPHTLKWQGDAITSSTSTMNVDINWTDGTSANDSYADIVVNGVTKVNENGGITSFSGLTPNTNYSVGVTLRCRQDSNIETLSSSHWTYPELNAPTLSLITGQEHDAIYVTANSKNGGNQYRFRINGSGWSAWQASNVYTFSSLTQMTTYTIGTQMQNTASTYASAETSASITTWYDPLTNLALLLVDRWYWYISIKSSYVYSGSISKFEFSIGGDQGYINTGTNLHSRGTKTENGSGNLQPHTVYTCNVRLTDNHGRTYAVSKNFNTLDDRVATIIEADGSSTFVQAFVIEPDGSTKQITPDIHGIIDADGSTTILPNDY